MSKKSSPSPLPPAPEHPDPVADVNRAQLEPGVVWGLGFGVWGLGVSGFQGFRVLGFRVSGLGFGFRV